MQSTAFSLNTSPGMDTYLRCPDSDTPEQHAIHTFLQRLQQTENGLFRRSLAHLLGAKNAIPPHLIEAYLNEAMSPAHDEMNRQTTPPVPEKISETLSALKDIGFLFVELLKDQSPLTFLKNKNVICFVSLSQEAVIDEKKFYYKNKKLLQELTQINIDYQNVELALLAAYKCPRKERNMDHIRALKQERKTHVTARTKIEKKLEKLDEAHKRASEMSPYIHTLNQLIQATALLVNEKNNCPVYFIPTLKFDSRFVRHFLTHIDSTRSALIKDGPSPTHQLMQEYLDIKSLDEGAKKNTLTLFENLMASDTPILAKSCSEKMLTNTMLKLIRWALQHEEQSLILNFKYEIHYPISCKTLIMDTPPPPHSNCKNCQFTYFLVHSSLSNAKVAAKWIEIDNMIDCLSEDDNPIHELKAVVIDPFNRAIEKQHSLLMNITDILNTYPPHTVLKSQMTALYQRITTLNISHIALFEQLLSTLWGIIAHINTEANLADVERAIRDCEKMIDDTLSMLPDPESLRFSALNVSESGIDTLQFEEKPYHLLTAETKKTSNITHSPFFSLTRLSDNTTQMPLIRAQTADLSHARQGIFKP